MMTLTTEKIFRAFRPHAKLGLTRQWARGPANYCMGTVVYPGQVT